MGPSQYFYSKLRKRDSHSFKPSEMVAGLTRTISIKGDEDIWHKIAEGNH